MSVTAAAKTTEVSEKETSAETFTQDKPLSIRVSPNSYIAALFLAAFFSALLFYFNCSFSAVSPK